MMLGARQNNVFKVKKYHWRHIPVIFLLNDFSILDDADVVLDVVSLPVLVAVEVPVVLVGGFFEVGVLLPASGTSSVS